jgi:hypothetical protein
MVEEQHQQAAVQVDGLQSLCLVWSWNTLSCFPVQALEFKYMLAFATKEVS